MAVTKGINPAQVSPSPTPSPAPTTKTTSPKLKEVIESIEYQVKNGVSLVKLQEDLKKLKSL
jgi:hypothetical protein